MYLFFDTETTGFPPSARIVQLAALLTDKDGNELKRLNSLVKPDGWFVPPEVTKIHGKTNEMCEKEGGPIDDILIDFYNMSEHANILIAHNMQFDLKMLWLEDCDYMSKPGFVNIGYFCTMKESVDICRLPGKFGYKWPKLIEAYRHFFGNDFENAHDAMADVMACKEIFFKLMELKK